MARQPLQRGGQPGALLRWLNSGSAGVIDAALARTPSIRLATAAALSAMQQIALLGTSADFTAAIRPCWMACSASTPGGHPGQRQPPEQHCAPALRAQLLQALVERSTIRGCSRTRSSAIPSRSARSIRPQRSPRRAGVCGGQRPGGPDPRMEIVCPVVEPLPAGDRPAPGLALSDQALRI